MAKGRRRAIKSPVPCAIDGCDVVTANYCTVNYWMPVCQGHAVKIGSEHTYLKIVMVEPALDRIATDQREPVTE